MSKSYIKEAIEDAKEIIQECLIQHIYNTLLTKTHNIYDFLNKEFEERLFEQSVSDKNYNLFESVELLSQLQKHEESDSGLWEGQQPKDAINTQATFTYRNAVEYYCYEIIKSICFHNRISFLRNKIFHDEHLEPLENKYLENPEDNAIREIIKDRKDEINYNDLVVELEDSMNIIQDIISNYGK